MQTIQPKNSENSRSKIEWIWLYKSWPNKRPLVSPGLLNHTHYKTLPLYIWNGKLHFLVTSLHVSVFLWTDIKPRWRYSILNLNNSKTIPFGVHNTSKSKMFEATEYQCVCCCSRCCLSANQARKSGPWVLKSTEEHNLLMYIIHNKFSKL